MALFSTSTSIFSMKSCSNQKIIGSKLVFWKLKFQNFWFIDRFESSLILKTAILDQKITKNRNPKTLKPHISTNTWNFPIKFGFK